MVQMLPTYTLERLQDTDIDLLMPLYHWYCKQSKAAYGEDPKAAESSDIVYRDGKPYKKVKANDAEWIKNAF